jgi:phosphotransferase system enzyme I (PtsI)
MEVLFGITASAGLVQGIACHYSEKVEDVVPHYVIEDARLDNEILRLREAFKKTEETMSQMIKVSEDSFDKRASEIFAAHLEILKDPVLLEVTIELIRKRHVNAEHAVHDAFEEYIKKYQESALHFAELSHDIIDVRNRLLASFGNISGYFECPAGERGPVIVISKRLTPSMVLNIPKEHVLAFVTEQGGFTTHATILARSYGVPVIFGIDIAKSINCGDPLIVDGFKSIVIINPDRTTEDRYAKKMNEIDKRKAVCQLKIKERPKTKKGLRITLKANISTPGEMDMIKDLNYDGIGLLRSEFLFTGRNSPPSEEEQLNMYRHILEEAEGRPVALRLLDIGGDKLPDYLTLPEQENPDLGIRGARSLEFFYDVYLTQVKAALRASIYGDLQILYPMVSDLADINSFKNLVSQAKSHLKEEGKVFNSDIKQGIMIETPAAVIMADELFKQVDFANIGSNDLLQYTLAASRGDLSTEKRYHIFHPSLGKFLEIIVKAARKNRKEACLCGEIASFNEFYPLFLSLGLRSFSVAVSKLQDIKCELLYTDTPSKTLPERFYKAVTKDDIDRLLKS